MNYSSEEDRHSGTFPINIEGSDTDSSPRRIKSCINRVRSKVLSVPRFSNCPHAPFLYIPATVDGQGFTVRNQHKSAASKDKGNGLAPPDSVEEEEGVDKRDLENYFVLNPKRRYSGVACESGPVPSPEPERVSWNLITIDNLPIKFPAEYRASGNVIRDCAQHKADLTVPDLCLAHWLGMFPDHIQSRLAGEDERACSLAKGWTAFSYAHIRAGLRYPLLSFLLLMLRT